MLKDVKLAVLKDVKTIFIKLNKTNFGLYNKRLIYMPLNSLFFGEGWGEANNKRI